MIPFSSAYLQLREGDTYILSIGKIESTGRSASWVSLASVCGGSTAPESLPIVEVQAKESPASTSCNFASIFGVAPLSLSFLSVVSRPDS